MKHYFVIAAFAGVALPLSAQQPPPPELKVAADTDFRHANSGVTLPKTLLGLPRTRILETAPKQLDVAGDYSPPGGDVLTVYIYHVRAGSVPVWFDRARWSLESRPVFGTPTISLAPAAIAPRPGVVASGMIAS